MVGYDDLVLKYGKRISQFKNILERDGFHRVESKECPYNSEHFYSITFLFKKHETSGIFMHCKMKVDLQSVDVELRVDFDGNEYCTLLNSNFNHIDLTMGIQYLRAKLFDKIDLKKIESLNWRSDE